MPGGAPVAAPTLGEVGVRRAFVTDERAAISDAFAERGPAQATLCEGWQTRDLLQHLVMRDAGPLRRLMTRKATTEAGARSAGWDELVDRFRAGPPLGSPFRLPGADSAANVEEFFVHHEDVRRAVPGWTRRGLPVEVEDAIWRRLRSPLGRLAVRRIRYGVHIQRAGGVGDGDHATLRAARPGIVVTGPPSELLMFLFGRQRAADVDLRGPADLRESLAHARLGF